MSSNKNKYFVVTETTVVSAINKSEALKAARTSRRVPGTTVLTADAVADRVPADTARALSAS